MFQGTHDCDVNAKCVNIIPVFVTNDGERLIIGTVEEVIERFEMFQARFTVSLRDHHAFTTLGYNCTCDSSLLGNGFDVSTTDIVDPDGCTPIQECRDGLHNCDVNADCTQLQPAGFECACKTGYTDTLVNGVVVEPGIACEDIGKTWISKNHTKRSQMIVVRL